MLWTGRVLSFLPAAFLLFDAVIKIPKPDFVIKATQEAGFPTDVLVPLGLVLLASVLLYLFPKTSVLGAILLTGYLGGAVCALVIKGDGLFNMLFPALFGVLLWLGLVLRDPRVRAVLALRT